MNTQSVVNDCSRNEQTPTFINELFVLYDNYVCVVCPCTQI